MMSLRMRGVPALATALSTVVALALTLGSMTLPAQASTLTEGARTVTQSTTLSQTSSPPSAGAVTGLAPRAIADGQKHTFTYDKYSFSIDGQRVNVWSAEFHYWRLPSPSLWRDVLQKIKANGYN